MKDFFNKDETIISSESKNAEEGIEILDIGQDNERNLLELNRVNKETAMEIQERLDKELSELYKLSPNHHTSDIKEAMGYSSTKDTER